MNTISINQSPLQIRTFSATQSDYLRTITPGHQKNTSPKPGETVLRLHSKNPSPEADKSPGKESAPDKTGKLNTDNYSRIGNKEKDNHYNKKELEKDENISPRSGEAVSPVHTLGPSPEAEKIFGENSAPEDKTGQLNKDDYSSNDNKEKDIERNKKYDIYNKKLQLDEREKLIVQNLKLGELHVKMHEQQHISIGGAYVRGGAIYQYTTGPDGKRYIVAGEVHLDTNPVPNNPKATIQKAQTIRKAALAPADPSSADRAVAASAYAMELKARQDLAKQIKSEKTGFSDPNHPGKISPQLSAYLSVKNSSIGKILNQYA